MQTVNGALKSHSLSVSLTNFHATTRSHARHKHRSRCQNIHSNLLRPGFHCIAPITRNSAPSGRPRSLMYDQSSKRRRSGTERSPKWSDHWLEPGVLRAAGAIWCNKRYENVLYIFGEILKYIVKQFFNCNQDTNLLKRWGSFFRVNSCRNDLLPSGDAFMITQQA